MKKSLGGLFALALLASCQKETGVNRDLADMGIDPHAFEQVDTLWYESQAIQALQFIKGADMKLVTFYESGKKKGVGQFKNREMDGEFVDWYENGQLKWKRSFQAGKPVGVNTVYFEDGKVEKTFDFAQQKLTWYYPNGQIREIQKEGDDFELQTFYLSGKPFEHTALKADGSVESKYYSEQEGLVYEVSSINRMVYHQGKPFSGAIHCQFADGKTSYLLNYQDGKRHGKMESYYGDGVMQSEGEYENGKELHFSYFYPNGQKEYQRDGRTKKTKRWDSKGNFLGEK